MTDDELRVLKRGVDERGDKLTTLESFIPQMVDELIGLRAYQQAIERLAAHRNANLAPAP